MANPPDKPDFKNLRLVAPPRFGRSGDFEAALDQVVLSVRTAGMERQDVACRAVDWANRLAERMSRAPVDVILTEGTMQ